MSRSKKITFALIVIAALIFSSLSFLDPVKGFLRILFQPIVRPVSSSTLKVKDFFYSITSLKSRLAGVKGLEDELQKLRVENVRLFQAGQENEILRQQLGLKQSSEFVLVSAQVVSRDPTGVRNLAVIDRGSSFGISPGNAVLDEFGNLLGVVQEVSGSSANVLVITDGKVKVDARVIGKDALGVISGSHGLGLNLDLVAQEIELERGDKVITSGLTGEMPAGILIGEIDEIQSSESELFQRFSVNPAAKTKDFRFVLVITDF